MSQEEDEIFKKEERLIEGGERIIVCNCKTKDCIIWLLFIIFI